MAMLRTLNEKVVQKITSKKSIDIDLGNFMVEDFKFARYKTFRGQLALEFFKPREDRNLKVKFRIKNVECEYIWTYSSLFLRVESKMWNLMNKSSDELIRLSSSKMLYSMDDYKIGYKVYAILSKIAEDYSKEVMLQYVNIIYGMFGGNILYRTLDESLRSVSIPDDSLEYLLDPQDKIVVEFKDSKFHNDCYTIGEMMNLEDFIYDSKFLPFNDVAFLMPCSDSFILESYPEDINMQYHKVKIKTLDLDYIEGLRNNLLDEDSGVEIFSPLYRDELLYDVSSMSDFIDSVDDVLAHIRRNNSKYLTIEIYFGDEHPKATALLDNKLNILKSSSGFPLIFGFDNVRSDIYDVFDIINEIDKVSKTKNEDPENIRTSIGIDYAKNKSEILNIIIRSITFLKSFYVYIKSNIDNTKDIDIRVHEVQNTNGHSKRNINYRKGCLVKGHFRHYKSGLVTFVHPYTRKGTNFEGRIVIEI